MKTKIHLPKLLVINANQRSIQRFPFTGNCERDISDTILLMLEKANYQTFLTREVLKVL